MTRKVAVVVTARPSYSRVKTAMEAISQHPDLELQVIVAASALLDRYGRVEQQIIADGFHVSARAYTVLEGENPTSMARTTGLGVLELASIFERLAPDVVVSVADRFETLSTAIAATYMGIPLAHVQGGEVTGSIDERVRHAVTKLADIHFPSSPLAAENIARMGEESTSIYLTGCPSIDLAARVPRHGKLTFDPFDLYGGVGQRLNLNDGYIIVMQHPVTTEYEHAREQVTMLLKVVEELGINTLWFWPNVDAGSDETSRGIRSFRESGRGGKMHFFKSVAPEHFIELLHHCRAIVGNSSVAIRECSYLGVPAVNVGGRQFGRERGPNVVDVDFDRSALIEAIRLQTARGKAAPATIFGKGDAGQQIADALATHKFRRDKRLHYSALRD